MRTRRALPHSTYCLLSLGDASVARSAFAAREGRLGGAVSTAIATHAVVVALAWGLASLPPGIEPASRAASASSLPPFVFAGATGDGSGSADGGNRSADRAALLRTRGADAIAVAASPQPSLATPDVISPEIEPTPALPVTPMKAGELPQIGAVDGVPGPPTNARGPGDSGTGTRAGSDRGLGEGPGDGAGDGPYGVGNGVTAPELIHRTQPQYTPEAMRAKIQGVAVLSGVVGADGTLRDIRVTRSLDGTFGLDQQAVACVRQWRFRPGTRQGRPVAVYVTIEVGFNLR